MERIISVWVSFLVIKIGWLIFLMFHEFQLVQSMVSFDVISSFMDICATSLVLSLINITSYIGHFMLLHFLVSLFHYEKKKKKKTAFFFFFHQTLKLDHSCAIRWVIIYLSITLKWEAQNFSNCPLKTTEEYLSSFSFMMIITWLFVDEEASALLHWGT